VDTDPRAKWADALLRATPAEPDPDAPPKKSRRERRREREEALPDLSAAPT
jgi:AI-2 transport protein TqsA